MGLILLILVIVLLCGGGYWGYGRGYVGYNPLGLLLFILLLLCLIGFFTPYPYRHW